MIKRLFWLVVGFVLGACSSWAITRRVRRFVARHAPAEVVERWNGGVRSVRRDLREAVTAGRGAMRERETQLREALDGPRERVRASAPDTIAALPNRQGVAGGGQ